MSPRVPLPAAARLLALIALSMGGCSIRTREIVERPTAGEALAALERVEPAHGAEWRRERDAILAVTRSQVAQLRTSEPHYFGPWVHRAEVEAWGPSFFAGASEERLWLDRALEAGAVTRDEHARLCAAVEEQARDPLRRQENGFVARPKPAGDLDTVARAAGRSDANGGFALVPMRESKARWPGAAVFWIAPAGRSAPNRANYGIDGSDRPAAK